MKITPLGNNQYINRGKKQDNLSFKNSAALTNSMNFLNNQKIFGAFFVDLASMVIPRTIIDMSRTPEAGIETARREASSSVLLAGVGLFGSLAALMLSPFLKNKYDVPLYKIEANNKTMDAFASAFSDAVNRVGSKDKPALAKAYLRNIFDGISGDKMLNPAKEDIIDTMSKYLVDSNDYILSRDSQKNLFTKLVAYTGETDRIKMLAKNGETIDIGAKALIKDTYSMGRAFLQDKVLKEFKQADKIADNNFLKYLKKMTGKQTVIGLVLASAVAMSMQPLNSWLTKKKTGKDGFSVVKGQKSEKDKSFGFKALKGAASAGMAAFVVSTIGNLKQLPQKLQFNGPVANVPQLKVVYGMTIIGRFLAARDKHELRESVFRDFMGFANWLIIGGIVSKSVAYNLDKNLIKPESISGKKGLKKYLSMEMKNHNDLIYGSDYVKKSLRNGVDVSSLKMKDILRRIDEPTKKMIKKLNIAQLSGYIYSGVALGILLPIINKKLTQHIISKNSKQEDNTQTIDPRRNEILSLKS